MKNTFSILVLLICLPLITGVASCKNVFDEASNKTSDEAYLYAAQLHADKKEWTAAIETMELMTPSGLAKRTNQVSLASYYGGRCGLQILPLATDVADGIASLRLWPVLMRSLRGATAAQFADCKQAETILLSVGATPALRNANENVLLAFIEFAKMGTALASSNADTNADGSLEAGFDACSSLDIADASVQELGTGLVVASSSLAASGSEAAGDALSAVTAMCSLVDTFLSTNDFCSSSNPADFSGVKLLALRALIKSNEIGFNTCNGSIGTNASGTANDCLCPVIP